MKPITMILLSVLSLGACTTYVGPDFVGRLGDAPALAGGSYSTGGGVTVAADIREQDGRTLLCGVWAQSHEQSILTKGRSRGVIAKGSVALGGDIFARDIAFMREVPPAADYGGSEANCRLTERAWRAGDAAREILIRIPRHEVYREIEGTGGGLVVIFRPTGPSAGDS